VLRCENTSTPILSNVSVQRLKQLTIKETSHSKSASDKQRSETDAAPSLDQQPGIRHFFVVAPLAYLGLEASLWGAFAWSVELC
jgi:hypothetical protein